MVCMIDVSGRAECRRRNSEKIIVRVASGRNAGGDPARGLAGDRCYLWLSGPSRRQGRTWRESTSSIT